MSGREAAIREALDVLTDVSLGEHRDMSLLHESSLNAYTALDSLLSELGAAREEIRALRAEIDEAARQRLAATGEQP